MYRTIVGILSSVLILMLVPASAAAREVISMRGSDTMVILNQRWAENYMAKVAGVTIQVTGGGSGTGMAALVNGITDISASSRDIRPREIEQLTSRYGHPPLEIPVAQDGVAVYVHESNPIQSLTIQQLKDIYQMRITNWRELGGADARIIVYSRENNSGTYVFFKEEVLDGEDFPPRVMTLPGTGGVVNAVSQDRNGIGYGGAAYARRIKPVSIGTEGHEPVPPTPENIASGLYPLARPLYFYLHSEPTPTQRRFIDWVLSEEGQSIVVSVGYFPIGSREEATGE